MGLLTGITQTLSHAQGNPLHKAAAAGDKEQVARLLAEGADVNAKDATGRTPLVEAVECEAIAELLLAKGSYVNARTNGGVTSLHGGSSVSLWAGGMVAVSQSGTVAPGGHARGTV